MPRGIEDMGVFIYTAKDRNKVNSRAKAPILEVLIGNAGGSRSDVELGEMLQPLRVFSIGKHVPGDIIESLMLP